MRALVTGSTGFSGSFLVEALRARGHEVVCASQRVSTTGVERVDLTSSSAWTRLLGEARPDHVFHLSGVAHTPSFAELTAVNTLAAAALLDATRQHQLPGAVLFVGSATEYGVLPAEALPVTEDFNAAPRIPYGAAKLAQTHLALDAIRRGTRAIVVRPSNIIGPRVPLFSAPGNFARQLREIELGRREPVLKVGDLSAERDFIDVRDLAACYVDLATHTTFSGIVNVSSGTLVSMHAVLDSLIAAFGLAVTVEREAARLRGNEVSKFSASRARLEQLLGQRALIPLAQSIADLVAHERAATA